MKACPRRGWRQAPRGAGFLPQSRHRAPHGPRAFPGSVLVHEHILVDFVGADLIRPGRYDADEVFRAARPKLEALKPFGCTRLLECTPNYLGRDPRLMARLADATGIEIWTNTGLYGAADHKYLPAFARTETAGTTGAPVDRGDSERRGWHQAAFRQNRCQPGAAARMGPETGSRCCPHGARNRTHCGLPHRRRTRRTRTDRNLRERQSLPCPVRVGSCPE